MLECTNRYNSSWNTQSNCNGGVVDYAMTMVRNVGIPNETTYPYVASQYTGSGFPSTVSSCFKSSNPNVGFSNPNGTLPTMKAYKNLTTTALKTLLQNGSAVGLIYADTGFLNYRSGVYSGCPDFSSSYSLINHAVEIVGYDANDNWIIKNSWSTNWG